MGPVMRSQIRTVIRAGALLLCAWLSMGLTQNAPDPNVPIVRITTSLVQIDAVVTDKHGDPVTDLTQSDFQILQDGKPRDITGFSFVSVSPKAPKQPSTPKPRKNDPGPPPLLRGAVEREQVRRTIAIVVNDSGMGFEDIVHTRDAVNAFVTGSLADGDLVSIMSSSGGMGVYAQFTTDREILKAAAKSLNWMPPLERSTVSPMQPPGEARMAQAAAQGAIAQAIDVLRNMPGRKSIVLMSAGGPSQPREQELEILADAAARSAVSIYPIDVRGVTIAGGPDEMFSRSDMNYLAKQTGGVFHGDNDIKGALVQALNDESSYYLLGYNPGPGSFDRRFHKIEVKVLRPGLTARSRTGYIGADPVQHGPVLEPVERRIVRSLMSAFRTSDIRTRLSSFFRNGGAGPHVESSLIVDVNDLRFDPGPDGKSHAQIEVLVANFDPSGRMTDHIEKGYRINFSASELEDARKYGVTFSISHVVKRPGPYQVRMAVHDMQSGKLGTAWQFLTAPDLSKRELSLSGVMLAEPTGQREPYLLSKPTARVFRQGREIGWEAEVFNPKVKDGVPKLHANVRVFRDGELITVTEPKPVSVTGPIAKKGSEVVATGSLLLDGATMPGEYVLQLVVADENDKSRVATQAVDFRVIP
jgi:VWFA-related protein